MSQYELRPVEETLIEGQWYGPHDVLGVIETDMPIHDLLALAQFRTLRPVQVGVEEVADSQSDADSQDKSPDWYQQHDGDQGDSSADDDGDSDGEANDQQSSDDEPDSEGGSDADPESGLDDEEGDSDDDKLHPFNLLPPTVRTGLERKKIVSPADAHEYLLEHGDLTGLGLSARSQEVLTQIIADYRATSPE